MKKYIVTVKEVWDQLVEIEASSKEEAILLVVAGDGDYLDQPEYNRTLERDSWGVEEDVSEEGI